MKNLFISHKLIVALFAVLFTLTFHTIGNAQTHIHVDAVNGKNEATGRGAAGNAYKSITFALLISERNNLPDPWHVHIHPGTYDADPAKPANEREVFPIRLRSNMLFQGTTTAAECIIDAQDLGETQTEILRGLDVGDVSIRNLTIQNMNRAHTSYTDQGQSGNAGGIVLRDTSGEREAVNSIEGCIVHNNSQMGVATNLPLVLIGNTFSNNRLYGVWTSTSLTALKNTFSHHNRASGLVFYSGDRGYNFVANISDNIFENNGDRGFWVNQNLTGDITGNQFRGNSASSTIGSGGGFEVGGTLTGNVSRNMFENNRGGSGGFYVRTLVGDVTHNTFKNNVAYSSGGGFYVYRLTGDVTHNTFVKNTAHDAGGGFQIGETGRFTGKITHNLFDSNSATQEGGAISLFPGTGNAEITNNIFINNTASSDGSSVHVKVPLSRFTNNLFMVSDGLSEGALISAVKVEESECRFHNNIFSGMKTAIYNLTPDDLPISITHNLFHNIGMDFVNQGGAGVGDDLEFWELLADGANNNIAGGLLLVDPGNRDFHLVAGSPAINAGTNEYAPADDFDGVARPVGGTVDIGPYEYKRVSTDQTATFAPEDVNQDGRVSIADVIEVAQSLGKQVSEKPRADVNGDGAISFADLVAIARYISKARSDAAAAPSHPEIVLDAATVRTWLALARIEDDGSLAFREGIANLERLLASLLPNETTLLANYPNPFNPETWIPYRLATPADVTVEIHTPGGTLVRRLELGELPVGVYADKSHAAYWDGRNSQGEPVASGVYFYTLTADDFTATRKMLIRK